MDDEKFRKFQDHPRVCGEKFPKPVTDIADTGSPPRMRGKASPQRSAESVTRITPAYAGKSALVHVPVSHYQDHPRVCGEKLQCRVPTAINSGSPPRMRGKAGAVLGLHTQHGITPAYAGKRSTCALWLSQIQDHPRVCGEKQLVTGWTTGVTRITPAYAGKSPVLLGDLKGLGGSPPRMRGKDQSLEEDVTWSRITPAYAGKSSPYSPAQKNLKDHPRVCGEKLLT